MVGNAKESEEVKFSSLKPEEVQSVGHAVRVGRREGGGKQGMGSGRSRPAAWFCPWYHLGLARWIEYPSVLRG